MPDKSTKYDPCLHPFEVKSTRIYLNSGEMNTRTFEKRCGNRRADKCQPCSTIWKDDAYFTLMRPSREHKGTITFITLTAPGSTIFGKTHTAQYQGMKSERCACRGFHKPEDSIIGLPILRKGVDEFEYRRVVEFNNLASRLVTVTLQKIYRQLATELGKDIKEVRLPTARVMEWQSRGLLHAHIIVRGHIPTFIIENAVNGSPKNKRRRIDPATHKGIRWGNQVNVRHLNSDQENQIGYLSAYMTKVVGYALKDVSTNAREKNTSRKIFNQKLRSHTNSVITCKKSWTECSASSQATDQMKAIDMDTNRRVYCVKHRRGFHQIGFTGNVLTLNKKWGATMKEEKSKRQLFASGNASPMRTAVKAGRFNSVKSFITEVEVKRKKSPLEELLDNKKRAQTVVNERNSFQITTQKEIQNAFTYRC